MDNVIKKEEDDCRFLVLMLDDEGGLCGKRWFDLLKDALYFADNCPLITNILIVKKE